MRKDVQSILDTHKVSLELKGYKEMRAREGYHMQATLYVNGKKAIFFEDMGNGGEVDFSFVDKIAAIPLLEIRGELARLSAYPGDENIGDLPYEFSTLFYEMVEDLLEVKRLATNAKTKTLVIFEDSPTDGSFSYASYNSPYDASMLRFLAKELLTKGHKTIKIWNESKSWVSYTREQLLVLAIKHASAPKMK